jgi:precorrin-6B methylase 2
MSDIEGVRPALLATMVAALRERQTRIAGPAAGLHNFYEWKLDHHDLLSAYDLGVADHFLARPNVDGRLWDIGAGVGQLACLLASEGHHVVAVDGDAGRFAAMGDVAAAVGRSSPGIAERIEQRFGRFPAVAAGEDVSCDVAICLGSTFTAPEETYREFAAALARFRAVVVDISHLFTVTHDKAEWDRRAGDMARVHGLSRQQHLFDWNATGFGYNGRVLRLEKEG